MSLKRNIVSNYLGRAYSIGAIYLFVPFYISILGVEAYGLIAVYTVILSLTALADVGLSAAFSREAARVSDKRGLVDLLATIEGTLLLTTAVIAAIVFVLAESIAQRWLNIGSLRLDDAVACIRIMAMTLPFQIAIGLYIGGLLGLQQQGVANLVLVLYTTLRSGIVILVIMVNPLITNFFGWQLLAAILCFFLARTILLRRLGHSPFVIGRYSPTSMRPVVKFAGGMMVIALLSALNTQLDKLVVSKLFPMEEFGYYALASMVAQIPYAVTAPLLVALLPRWTSLAAEGRVTELAALYETYSYRIAMLSSVTAFGLIFFAADVLSIWLQQDGLDAKYAQIVMILAVGGLFLSLAALPFFFGLAHGHNRTSVLLGAVTLFLTTPLLLAAASWLGLVGAAIPWVVLNAITFAVLSTVVNGRYFRSNRLHWIVTSVALPVSLGALFMLGARMLADLLYLSSFAGCAIAAASASAAAVLVFHHRPAIRLK